MIDQRNIYLINMNRKAYPDLEKEKQYKSGRYCG